jgi:hypothetical protein
LCWHSYTIQLPQKYKISKKLIVQHCMILCLQFITSCYFSRHKTVDVTTLNLLVMHMDSLF